MRLLPNKTRERLPRLIAPLMVAAAVFGCMALGARTLQADGGEGPLAMGGGDAIGSLPFAPPLPPENLNGETMPSIVLEGPSLAAIQALVVDAWGDGYAEFTDLGEEGGVRVELQGWVSVLLDRNLLNSSGVRFGLDVSQGFAGGMGIITQNQHVLRTQELPVAGDLCLPLGTLSASGLLDSGGLTLHSVSLARKHHGLDISGSGGTLRLVSYE